MTLRQQPETVKGTIFVWLECEDGTTQVIVWRHVQEAQRQVLPGSHLLADVCNLIEERLADLSLMLGRLATESWAFARQLGFHRRAENHRCGQRWQGSEWLGGRSLARVLQARSLYCRAGTQQSCRTSDQLLSNIKFRLGATYLFL